MMQPLRRIKKTRIGHFSLWQWLLLAFFIGWSPQSMMAQENVLTVGLQFKPMVPMKFMGNTPEPQTVENFTTAIQPQFGMAMGMIIRKGFTKMWSLESGINFVQRNYQLQIEHPQMPGEQSMNYRFISYDIPIQGMVYVKLGKQLYMNASGGFSFNFYPSNIESFANTRKDTLVFDFYQKTTRTGWLQFALLANYGFEWRTKTHGYFYLGASYQRPFNDIATTRFEAQLNRNPARINQSIQGNYLTLDVRYFFHEKPQRKLP